MKIIFSLNQFDQQDIKERNRTWLPAFRIFQLACLVTFKVDICWNSTRCCNSVINKNNNQLIAFKDSPQHLFAFSNRHLKKTVLTQINKNKKNIGKAFLLSDPNQTAVSDDLFPSFKHGIWRSMLNWTLEPLADFTSQDHLLYRDKICRIDDDREKTSK